ncbi:hypothetical protein C8A00DRAFT_29686 [Chaetomidium leptoderma]|uniref:Uncharacterized protein n=1 Tax=Chaetomidium leptoderma TaxID=669021 RepID=A0AAN6VTA7_9PEZI|nr:hypothetical protein C8A00DRAFT_29686 [Chaetomidium leptoderma]
MVRLLLAALPALLGATLVAATNTNTPTADGVAHVPHDPTAPIDTSTNTDAPTPADESDILLKFIGSRRCRPRCHCETRHNSTEMAEIDAERVEKGCAKCNCDRYHNGAGKALASGVAAVMVVAAGVVAFA